MSTASEAATVSSPARRVRLDRPMLVSNLVAGAVWLLFPAAIGAWPLSVIGSMYVAAASLFFAVVYARDALTVRQEALAWAAPWLAAVALWAAIVGAVAFENTASRHLAGLYAGLLVGTLSYLGWQLLALAVRQFLAWRSNTSSFPA
ncbi:MAG: hypothetical protein Q7J48_15370 [Nocardioides sp.]|nr:hypothetical protein [Nocardioides sp.]